MSEFGSVGGQSNFTHSTAYAAALRRAKEIAAKINPGGSPSDRGVKRELEDGYQPEPKKLAGPGGDFQPNQGPGGQQGPRSGPLPSVMNLGNDGIFNEEIVVPDKIVGLIIGRGGEQITRLQSESGCKIQMERSRGTAERQCTLTGTRDAINRAREMVMNIVSTLSRNDNFGPNGGGGGGNDSGGGLGNSGGGNAGGNESDGHPPFQQNPNSGPPGQAFLEIMVPGPKVGLIIGKGGETIKHLQDTTGAKMVVVQDSNTQDYEKPLRITGTRQQVDHAKELVHQMIADKDVGGNDRRNRGDRGHFGGGPPGVQNNFNNDYDNTSSQSGSGIIEILVPRAAVGVVIGKGGEMIKKIQNATGAKLQFEQGRDDGPGDRKCILTGKPEQCEEARDRVKELIDSVQNVTKEVTVDSSAMSGGGERRYYRGKQRRDDRRDPGRGSRSDRNDRDRRGPDNDRQGRGNDRWSGQGGRDRSDRSEITLAVPANRAGFVIGKGGERIKQINAQCGAYCEIDRKLSAVNPAEKVFVIRGTPEQIEEAKRLIIEYSGIEDYYGSGGGNSGNMGGGGVGGGGGGGGGNAGGNNNPSHHQLQMTSTAYPNQGGFQPQGWGGPSTNSYQWGGVVPSNTDSSQSQVPINPVNGQPDYTLQWVEYYRSIGMVREAEMIEQQTKNNKVMPNPNQGQQGGASSQGMGGAVPAQQAGNPQANGGQTDYSAQWAEYYRSIGKIKEAEAIEAQIKAKAAGGAGQVPVQGGNQGSQQQPGQMMGGAPQQQAQFGQFGGYQQQGAPGPYYGGPGQGAPYGNYPGYGGGYPQGGSEN